MQTFRFHPANVHEEALVQAAATDTLAADDHVGNLTRDERAAVERIAKQSRSPFDVPVSLLEHLATFVETGDALDAPPSFLHSVTDPLAVQFAAKRRAHLPSDLAR